MPAHNLTHKRVFKLLKEILAKIVFFVKKKFWSGAIGQCLHLKVKALGFDTET